ISTSGEEDRYIFTLGATGRFYFDTLSTAANLTWSLTGRGGRVVTNRSLSASDASGVSDANVLTTLAAGSYTLSIKGTGSATGAYSFKLVDVDAAANSILMIDDQSISTPLSPASSMVAY